MRSDSVRQPFRDFRFLWRFSGRLDFAIYYDGRRHEDTILGQYLDIFNIHRFRVQTLLLHYVLNQVVELVAFGSTCA